MLCRSYKSANGEAKVKRIKTLIASLILLQFFQASAFAIPPTQGKNKDWMMDQAHCKAIFACGHEGLAPVTGWFDRIMGGAKYDGKNLQNAQLVASIEVNSLKSGCPPRDYHLKSADFFDAKNNPLITFHSTAIKPIKPGKFKMEGDLEIKEIKKHVVLDCTGPLGPVIEDERKIKRLGFTAKTTINRKDFGIKWNREVSKGVFMVADNVDLTFEIELMKEPGVD